MDQNVISPVWHLKDESFGKRVKQGFRGHNVVYALFY